MSILPKVNGLVISAGFSSRMPGLKPLMNFDGKPFLAGILLKLSFVCDTITVVTGFESHKIKEETQCFLGRQILNINSKLDWSFNPDFKNGMFSSLQTGIRQLKKSEWILYHFVDQPGLPIDFYTGFQKHCDPKYDWIQPTFQSQNGHPLLFSQKTADLILNSDHTQSLRDLKKNDHIQKKYWPCNFPQVLQDFDSEEQLINRQ